MGGDSTSPPDPQPPSTLPGISYAAATKQFLSTPRLTPVPLAYRPISYVEDIPAILFNPVEETQLCRQRENTLIMKFSAGKPRLAVIREHIAAHWNLEMQPAVGYLNPRHVTLHMASIADTKRHYHDPPINKHESIPTISMEPRL